MALSHPVSKKNGKVRGLGNPVLVKRNIRVSLLAGVAVAGMVARAQAATYEVDVKTNTTLTSPIVTPPGYTQVTYGVGSGATLTLGAGSNPTSTFYAKSIAGGGLLINNTTITTSGTAVAYDGNNFSYPILSFTNNGTILSAVSAGQYALSVGSYQFGNLVNTGSITTTGAGGAVNAGPNYNFTNSGSVAADGLAVYAFDSVLTNSGTIRSNTGVGAYLYGNVGYPASSSGSIYGQTIGVQILGPTLTNTGTITSPGLAASLDPYGTLINAAGGTVNGNIGAALYGYTFRAGLDNAGTINGNVNFGTSFSGSGNVVTLRPGSVITGNLVIGGGNDTFAVSLVNNGPGQFAGVNGTVTAPEPAPIP